MNKIQIGAGLAVNITNLEGYFVITDVRDDKVSLYSIANGTEDIRPLGDIELAVNASARSMNKLTLELIMANIEETTESLENEIVLVEEQLKKLRGRQQKLIKIERQCVFYETHHK